VIYVRRYLLVLDMDLLAVDAELDLAPINYLVARQERGPCHVVVLSLASTRQAKLPALELVLGAATSLAGFAKFPVVPRPDHDVNAAAEHRMNRAVRHLKMIGCAASGLISDEDLVKAVRAETRSHNYDAVILATGRSSGTRLARVLHRDPVHQLRRRWRQRLIVFASGPGTESDELWAGQNAP
jgi:hypothetical protein